MSTALAIGATMCAAGLVVAAALGAHELVRGGLGQLLLLAACAIVPLAVSAFGLSVGVRRSSETRFCVSCHEMDRYGRSLLVDNAAALSAVHYQRRLIPREQTCFACHTDYAMFGDAKAKLNGLRHVWVHYTSGPPEQLSLYRPYPNHNCLHCHDGARGYLEVALHEKNEAALRSGERSCLGCHALGHDLAGVDAGNLWPAAGR